jgi:hypothetical protein
VLLHVGFVISRDAFLRGEGSPTEALTATPACLEYRAWDSGFGYVNSLGRLFQRTFRCELQDEYEV